MPGASGSLCTNGQPVLPEGLHPLRYCVQGTPRHANAVIHEVDEALQTLIREEALNGSDVEVSFDAPSKEWASRRNAPTVNLYLYDIREDLRRRERGLLNEYDERGRVVARRLPPRHFKLSYLITAWTQRPQDEHRLLSAVLGCFLRHDRLPDHALTGGLARLTLPVPVSVALPPPEDRSFADVWSALGGELKPSLDIVVCAPTDTGQTLPAGPPVTEEVPRLHVGDMQGGHEEQAGGTRRSSSGPAGPAEP